MPSELHASFCDAFLVINVIKMHSCDQKLFCILGKLS